MGTTGRRLLQLKGLAGCFGFNFHITELIVVEHCHGLYHVTSGRTLITNYEQVLSVLGVRRGREVMRSGVHASGRFIKINDNEFMVHPAATASTGFLFKR